MDELLKICQSLREDLYKLAERVDQLEDRIRRVLKTSETAVYNRSAIPAPRKKDPTSKKPTTAMTPPTPPKVPATPLPFTPILSEGEGGEENPEENREEKLNLPSVGLLKSLTVAKDALIEQGFTLPPRYILFIDRAQEIIRELTVDELKGDKGSKILVDCVHFIDQILYDFDHPEIREILRATSKGFVEYLSRERDYAVLPYLDTKNLNDITSPREKLDLNDFFEIINLPLSTSSAGSICYIQKRCFFHKGDIQKGILWVSYGDPNPLADFLTQVKSRLAKFALENPELPQSVSCLKKINQWMNEVAQGSLPSETLYRYSLNLMDELSIRCRIFQDLQETVVQRLKKLGLSEMVVTLGDQFDEKYSPGKYERKKVKSDRPKNTIVAVRQRGFINRQGAVVQKAIVHVSGE